MQKRHIQREALTREERGHFGEKDWREVGVAFLNRIVLRVRSFINTDDQHSIWTPCPHDRPEPYNSIGFNGDHYSDRVTRR